MKSFTTLPRGLIPLLSLAVGVTVANLYYAQPLTALIAKSLDLNPAAAGLTVTLTQVGYCLGVLFLVPLGDLVENRRLILTTISVAVLALLGVTFAKSLAPYFLAAFAVGVGASTIQIIVPYTASFTPLEHRGRVVGGLMSGLMLGIMLSRPIAGFITDLFSWHAVFLISAVMMALVGVVLSIYLPRRPAMVSDLTYPKLIVSLGNLFVQTPILRRRAIYQAFIFGSFCLFWTASPLLLSGPQFHLSQTEIAIFALVGITGAVSAPFAGRMADKGYSRRGTMLALSAGSLSFLLTQIFTPGSGISLAFLVMGAILLDAGVTANLVLGQRAIFSLNPTHHSRLNGLYIATIFVGGATGSSLGAWAYANGGWQLTAWVGFLMPAMALLYFLTEFKSTLRVTHRS